MMKIHTGLKFLFFLISVYILAACGNQESKKPSENEVLQEVKSTGSKETRGVIVFFGNSLTAGYGLKPEEAFPALIQKKIDSAGLNYKVINAGVSGETTSGGLSRINWVLKQKMDVFVLELGANDGLRGMDLKQAKKNLQAIITAVKKANPETKFILAGMQIPPNMGKDYAEEFKAMYPALAKENSIGFIPFLLEGTAGESKLNQEDGIHPNQDGQKIVANNVWKILKSEL